MFKIIKRSKVWFIFSGSLMVLSIASLFIFGLRLGIDYKGGTVLEYKSTNPDKIKITEEILTNESITGYQVKQSGDSAVVLRIPTQSSEQHVALTKKFKEKISDYNEVSYDSVGATISKDLIKRSVLAVILASLGIVLYIAYAFRRIPRPLSSWIFGASAVIALIHDLVVTTGIVSVISHFVSWMEVDALFLTALLTIMGFSVHDTIVVYDRLRENFIKNPHQDIALTTEESVNQTLARSINTSMTVIIVLLALYLLGGVSIRHFILTLIIGIFFGTYSSIFIAAAIVVLWHKKNKINLAK